MALSSRRWGSVTPVADLERRAFRLLLCGVLLWSFAAFIEASLCAGDERVILAGVAIGETEGGDFAIDHAAGEGILAEATAEVSAQATGSDGGTHAIVGLLLRYVSFGRVLSVCRRVSFRGSGCCLGVISIGHGWLRRRTSAIGGGGAPVHHIEAQRPHGLVGGAAAPGRIGVAHPSGVEA